MQRARVKAVYYDTAVQKCFYMLNERFVKYENLDATLFTSIRRCPGAILCIARLIYVFASFHRRPTTIHWHE